MPFATKTVKSDGQSAAISSTWLRDRPHANRQLPRTREPYLQMLTQPLPGTFDLCVPSGNRLEDIPCLSQREIAEQDRCAIPLQAWIRKHLPGVKMHARIYNHIPGFRKIHRVQRLANPFHPACLAPDKNRYISTELRTQFLKSSSVQTAVP